MEQKIDDIFAWLEHSGGRYIVGFCLGSMVYFVGVFVGKL